MRTSQVEVSSPKSTIPTPIMIASLKSSVILPCFSSLHRVLSCMQLQDPEPHPSQIYTDLLL